MDDVSVEFKTFLKWAIASLIDGSFLVAWAFIQYGSNWLIAKLELSGIDKWVFLAFQVLFAVSTLAPVIFYIYKDLVVMYIRTQVDIETVKTKARADMLLIAEQAKGAANDAGSS